MGVDSLNFSHFFNNKIHASIKPDFSDLKATKVAIPNQKHTSNVQFITKSGEYENVDGLVTSKQYDITLTIKVADCVPIYIYDPKTDYYGLVHSGW